MSYNGETKLFTKDNDVLPFSKGNLTFFSNPFIDIDDWGHKNFNLNNSFWSFEYLKSLYETRYVKFDCLSSEEDLLTQINENDVSQYIYIGYDLWGKPNELGFDLNSYDFNLLQNEVLRQWENCSFKTGSIIYTPDRTLTKKEIEVITFKPISYENTACRMDRNSFRRNYPKTYVFDNDLAFITKEDDYENWRNINDFSEKCDLPDFVEGQNIAMLTY